MSVCAAPALWDAVRAFQPPPCLPLSPQAHSRSTRGTDSSVLNWDPFPPRRGRLGDQLFTESSPILWQGRLRHEGAASRLTHHLPHSSDSAWVGGAEPGGRSAGPLAPPCPSPIAAARSWRANACWAAVPSPVLSSSLCQCEPVAQHSHQDRDPCSSAPADHPASNTELHLLALREQLKRASTSHPGGVCPGPPEQPQGQPGHKVCLTKSEQEGKGPQASPAGCLHRPSTPVPEPHVMKHVSAPRLQPLPFQPAEWLLQEAGEFADAGCHGGQGHAVWKDSSDATHQGAGSHPKAPTWARGLEGRTPAGHKGLEGTGLTQRRGH